MQIIKCPKLVRSYRGKIASGRKFSLNKIDLYVRGNFQYDPSGNLILGQDNKPLTVPMEGLCFIFGMPLSSETFAQRLDSFNKTMEANLGDSQYASFGIDHFHMSFLGSYVWSFGESNGTPHPMMQNRTALESFITQIGALTSPFRSFTFYFDKLVLFDNGVIVALGFPQDYPDGPDNPSAAEVVRMRYATTFPEANHRLDIFHITVGRLLTMPTRAQQQPILAQIDQFNQTPLGPISFSTLKIGYEQRILFPEIIREIDL